MEKKGYSFYFTESWLFRKNIYQNVAPQYFHGISVIASSILFFCPTGQKKK
jgi:hypothetical protein